MAGGKNLSMREHSQLSSGRCYGMTKPKQLSLCVPGVILAQFECVSRHVLFRERLSVYTDISSRHFQQYVSIIIAHVTDLTSSDQDDRAWST